MKMRLLSVCLRLFAASWGGYTHPSALAKVVQQALGAEVARTLLIG